MLGNLRDNSASHQQRATLVVGRVRITDRALALYTFASMAAVVTNQRSIDTGAVCFDGRASAILTLEGNSNPGPAAQGGQDEDSSTAPVPDRRALRCNCIKSSHQKRMINCPPLNAPSSVTIPSQACDRPCRRSLSRQPLVVLGLHSFCACCDLSRLLPATPLSPLD